MDVGHPLIETGSQSGKSAKAVTVHSEEVEPAKLQLIGHYSTDCDGMQDASVGGQSR